MEFWLVSPNIDMKGGKTLERWKEIIRNRKAVFMGWPANRRTDGTLRLGRIFAGIVEGGVDRGDLILSAYREDWRWHLVACGKVNSESRNDPKLSDGLNYETCRELKPFVPLQQDARFSFKGTTADGEDAAHRRRVIPALVKFKPEINRADKLLRDKLMKLLQLPPEPPKSTAPLPEYGYLRASRSQQKVIVRRHNRLSNAFVKWLQKRRYKDICQEQGRVDVDFFDGITSCRAELKVCYGVKTREAIREALGQLLEYNYYPETNRQPAEKWFLVLDERPTGKDIAFLRRLRTTMRFPLSVCWRSGDSFQMQRC
jgi:hypothetical protein